MPQTPISKQNNLKANLKQMRSVLIAYSGGTDSAYLAKTAHDLLGKNATAVTKTSPAYPKAQLDEAKKTAKQIGITHIIIPPKPSDLKNIEKNQKDRCYHCKNQLYKDLKIIAKKQDITHILDGTNYTDKDRPSIQVIKEQNIQVPLKDAKLTKKDIRTLSKKQNLPTWNKPEESCIATRFPQGTKITAQNLEKIQKAENIIKTLGIKQLRIRHHNTQAIIEIPKKDIPQLLKNQKKITKQLKNLGYPTVALDLEPLKE
ncbi:MAG: ATP-dependent sacrificial sulfur transferase LarE [Candidatus Nanohalarchaeota archaeon]|nr:MAG: ATP-dependent sacrificial sulfur transferase LarE [Candidatus Nanohaloarchaeota archaeon]